jgi:hypothetical protein
MTTEHDPTPVPAATAEFLRGPILTRDEEDVVRRQRWLRAATQRGQQLRAAISVATEALSLREADGARELERLRLAFEVAQRVADSAQEDYIGQQRANDKACMPLRNRIADLTSELNKLPPDPQPERQWAPVPGYEPRVDTSQTTLVSNSLTSPNQG